MAKPPKKPRDYARPTRSKAHRPEAPEADAALDALLNPAIGRGTAGMGSGTGLQAPPDNSFDRRADRRGEHTARKSVVKGFDEAPQRGYTARGPLLGLRALLRNVEELIGETPGPQVAAEGQGRTAEEQHPNQIQPDVLEV